MKSKLLLILLLATAAVFAQGRQLLQGKVVAESDKTGVPGIFVINTNSGIETKTDATGFFTIDVKEGDRIAVYGKNVTVRNFTVNSLWFKEKPFTLAVEYEGNQLKEVVINDTLNSESLGIVPPGQKRYTQMERKMYTTGDFKALDLLKILYGGMPFDPLINKISGRTKRVKKELETERKLAATEAIGNAYTPGAFIAELKIPEEYVEGFIYYAVEDKELAAALQDKNTEMVKFLLTGLSEKYLKLLEEKR